MLNRIQGRVWFCCPVCGQKLLQVVDFDASCHGLEGVCKKCKCEYPLTVDKEELEAVMTEEERELMRGASFFTGLARNLTPKQMDWLLDLALWNVRNNLRQEQTNGKCQAN